MRVGQRLFLAVLPAVLGVLTVAALAYWGRYAQTAPEWVVVVAVVAAIGSLVVAWTNTRYVAQRIQRLADRNATRPSSLATMGLRSVAATVPATVADVVRPGRVAAAGPDELDAIEATVDRLSTAVSSAEADRRAEAEALRQRRMEYADLLATVSQDGMRYLDEIRLPLHILLEARFGDVNENQEEMLGAARTAAEEAAAEFQRLREIADLDRGTLVPRRDNVKLSDVVGSLLPALTAEAERRGARVAADIAPALPSIVGDRARLQQALGIVLHESAARTGEGGELRMSLAGDGKELRLMISPGPATPPTTAMVLASRLLAAQGETLVVRGDEITIHFSRS